ncbi:MAG: cytochrome c family protein [Alphaproteobacteria bacterium]|nr:cytochrome c family protein [Alphaproteobacteria bacterium]
MSNMEFNKIFAAILVAGIVAMLSGFIAENVISAKEISEDAVKIEGSEGGAAAGGPAKPAGPEPILELIATADVAKGEKIAKICGACHTFDPGGPAGVGPNLYGIIGNKKAHMAGFAYSDGMVAKGGHWDYAALNHFLWKPKAYIDGTKMTFVGLKKPQERADLIAWLRTKAGSPPALPSAAEIAAEKAELAPEPVAAATEEAKPAEAAH